MSGARKIMNSAQEITISEKSREKARKMLEAMTFEPVDIEECQKVLDRYCEEFGASSYHELMSRADVTEFSPEISSQILEYYELVTRPSSASL